MNEINEYAGDITDLEDRYQSLSDDELLQLSIEGGLAPEAGAVLQTEMRKRSLGAKDIRDLEDWEEQQNPKPESVPQRVFLGYGVRFIGHKYLSTEDERQGVFVATKFIVLRYIFLVPIGSYRVTQVASEYPRTEGRVSLQWDQVWLGLRPAVIGGLIGLALAAVMILTHSWK